MVKAFVWCDPKSNSCHCHWNMLISSGPWYCGGSSSARPRCSAEWVSAASLPSHLHHVAVGIKCSWACAGNHQLPDTHSFLVRIWEWPQCSFFPGRVKVFHLKADLWLFLLWWLNHIQNNWFSYRLSTCLFLRKITGKTKMLKCLAFRAVFVFSQCYEKQSYCCALLTCSNFSFSNTFHILRPTKAPGFVYAWLELISHRIFIARMLAHTPQQKVWLQFIFSELKSSRRRMPIWCDAVSRLLKCTSMAVLFLLSSIFTVT